LNVSGTAAIYFEIRTILKSATFQVSKNTIVQLCQLDCEFDSEQQSQPDLMLMSCRLNFSGIYFYSWYDFPLKLAFKK
jgi:hypothetical protein